VLDYFCDQKMHYHHNNLQAEFLHKDYLFVNRQRLNFLGLF